MFERRLLVCDLDNTLYDWVAYFVPAFYAMVDVAVEIIGCDRETLLDDFRIVHQTAHDSEQPFALLETRTVKRFYPNTSKNDLLRELDPAFHAFNAVRKRELKLYPDVRETLEHLSSAGVGLVAHTESKLFGAVDRLRRLDLFKYFAKIYCRERSIASSPVDKSDWFANIPMHKVIELSHHQAKPNADVLLEICAREGTPREQAVYVGDSIARDVLMARRANVFSVWAKYGSIHAPQLYAGLVRVSHWSAEEVKREKQLLLEAQAIRPDLIADNSFSEVCGAFEARVRPQRVRGNQL